MRHRSRTGSRAGKMKHAKGRFCVGLWRVFFVSMGWKRSARTRSLHPADAVLRRVWEVPNKHFCTGPQGHGAKIADWYQSALLARTPSSRRSLCIIEELFAADNRPLLEIAIYMATLQTENHVTGAFKKADIPLPTHTTFAVLQGNKLLLHLTPEAGTELIGFAHSVYR